MKLKDQKYKAKTEASLAASQEAALDINSKNSEYRFMSRDECPVQSRSIRSRTASILSGVVHEHASWCYTLGKGCVGRRY